jgi:hypothetical protein
MLEVKTAHFVKIAYHGATNTKPSRYIASWEGWPSQGGTVRKTISYTSERDDMARDVAQLFTAWLSDMPGDEKDDPSRLIFTAKELTLASMGDGAWALLVKTEAKRAGQVAA